MDATRQMVGAGHTFKVNGAYFGDVAPGVWKVRLLLGPTDTTTSLVHVRSPHGTRYYLGREYLSRSRTYYLGNGDFNHRRLIAKAILDSGYALPDDLVELYGLSRYVPGVA